MAFAPAPGVARFTMKALWNAVIDVNTVWHMERQGELLGDPWTAEQLTQSANRVMGAFDSLLANVSTAYVAKEVVAQDLSVDEGAQISYPVSNTGDYTGATQTGPYEGPLIQWLTGTAGRRNGRTFLPGIPEGAIDANGQIVGANVEACKTQAAAALAFLAAATDGTHPGPPLTMVILSAKPPPGDPFRTPRPVVGYRVGPHVSIQRRRRING